MYNNKIGVTYQLGELLQDGPEKLFSLDIECVQLVSWETHKFTKENAEKVKEMLGGKLEVSSFWAGYGGNGPCVWNNIDGPITIGLVPQSYRFQRLQDLIKGADFAEWLGASNIATHVGFIPENPCFSEYRGVLHAIKMVVDYCKNKNINFNFETGQETPTTLMRIIKDIGSDNVGINLDPANLIMYGRGNPVDALDLFQGYIKGTHIKDGDYQTENFYELGEERVVGEGSVNFPVFLPKLLKQGYKGNLYIERETSGEQQLEDIRKTITYIKNILNGA